jgi:hypothetical protein
MPPSKSAIGKLLLCIFVVFLLGGGIDVITSFQRGQADAQLMEHPKMTGLSPIAIFLYGLMFIGGVMWYWSGRNFGKNDRLAIKQWWAGLILVPTSLVLLVVVANFGM